MKNYIPHIILLLVIALCIFRCESNDTVHADSLKTTKATAKKVTDSLLKVNRGLNRVIDVKQDSIDILKTRVLQLEQQSIIINNDRDEKINRVDSYDVSELQQYFANRYGRK